MNIILGNNEIESISEKYVVLELDTFVINNEHVPSYAVIEAGDIPLGELETLEQYKQNHANLINEYRKRNWNFCEQMIEHLSSRWGGSMTTFYAEILMRIANLKEQDLGEDWDYAIQR